MKVLSTCKNQLFFDVARRFRLDRCAALQQTHENQVRHVHESYIPKGRGGRSSFNGVVATVFGSTGFLGHVVVNHLGACGSTVMIPYRGTFQRVQRMRVMGDLGQFLLREKFSIKQDDDTVMGLIKHSNCVINLIKTRVPTNHYTMEEVNIEWPKRLANLVAEKNDGTRLIHVTHLNCHQEQGRAVSNILQQDHVAEKAIREIYPDSIIARSSDIHGSDDNYTSLLVNKKFDSLWFLGAVPVLYDAGRSTVIQPVYVSDVAEGIARLTRHPDAPGHTFEFVGPDRFTLHDFVDHIYRLMSTKFYDFDTIGPMDASKATYLQKIRRQFLEFYLWKRFKPRFWLPRMLDIVLRNVSGSRAWITADRFNQLHITDRTSGLPGLKELGIDPCEFEEKAYDHRYKRDDTFQIRSEKQNIPRVTSEELPETEEVQKESAHGRIVRRLS